VTTLMIIDLFYIESGVWTLTIVGYDMLYFINIGTYTENLPS